MRVFLKSLIRILIDVHCSNKGPDKKRNVVKCSGVDVSKNNVFTCLTELKETMEINVG